LFVGGTKVSVIPLKMQTIWCWCCNCIYCTFQNIFPVFKFLVVLRHMKFAVAEKIKTLILSSCRTNEGFIFTISARDSVKWHIKQLCKLWISKFSQLPAILLWASKTKMVVKLVYTINKLICLQSQSNIGSSN